MREGDQGHQENSIWAASCENFAATHINWGDMKMKSDANHCGQIPEQLHSSVLRATATCLGNNE